MRQPIGACGEASSIAADPVLGGQDHQVEMTEVSAYEGKTADAAQQLQGVRAEHAGAPGRVRGKHAAGGCPTEVKEGNLSGRQFPQKLVKVLFIENKNKRGVKGNKGKKDTLLLSTCFASTRGAATLHQQE